MSFEKSGLDNDKWYASNENLQSGPYTFAQLVAAASNKTLTATDLIWHAAKAERRPAGSVPGLFSIPPDEAAPDRNIRIPSIAADEPRDATLPQAPVETDAGNEPKRNYFIRHWRGELSLPKSYWINGILALIVSSIFVGAFTVATESLQNSHGVTILVAIAALQIWQSVGIWRSSNRHEGRGGSAIWAGLAKLAVILGVIRFCFEFSNSFVPLVSEHFQIALGDAKFGESHFKLLRDGRELEFSGGINIDAAKKLDEALSKAPQVSVLHLNSHGGRLLEADLMAKIVQQHKLTTYVHTSCESACTHIFLAGRERWIGQNAKLGFHRPSSSLESDNTRLVTEERAFLKSMNLPESFIAKALLTKPESMWHPTHAELLAARAISGIANRNQFAMSGPSTSINSDRMAQILAAMPIYAALKQHEPETYEQVLRIMSEGFQRGSSEEEIASKGRAIIAKILGRKLSFAADSIVLESADIYITYMQGLRKTDSASCVALFDNTKGVPLVADLRSLFPEASAKELDLNTRVLQIKTDGAAPQQTAPAFEENLPEVIGKLQSQPELKLDVMSQEKLLPSDYAPYCETATAFLTEIRRLPPGKAAAVFRHIFALADK